MGEPTEERRRQPYFDDAGGMAAGVGVDGRASHPPDAGRRCFQARWEETTHVEKLV